MIKYWITGSQSVRLRTLVVKSLPRLKTKAMINNHRSSDRRGFSCNLKQSIMHELCSGLKSSLTWQFLRPRLQP